MRTLIAMSTLGLIVSAVAAAPLDAFANNVDFPIGGNGFTRTFAAPATIAADAEWTIAGWVRISASIGPALVGGVGSETPGGSGAFLIAGPTTLGFWDGQHAVTTPARLGAGWHAVAAVARAGCARNDGAADRCL